MYCRECGGKTIVMDTRSFEEEVYRKRKCLNCGRNFYTAEYEDDIEQRGKNGLYDAWKDWRVNH